MSLPGFDRLFALADAAAPRVPVAAMGGDDPTVLAALRAAADRGWVSPVVVGPASAVRAAAGAAGVALDGSAWWTPRATTSPPRRWARCRRAGRSC